MTGRENLVDGGPPLWPGPQGGRASAPPNPGASGPQPRPPTARCAPIRAACAAGSTSGASLVGNAAAAPARRAHHRPRPGSRIEVWDAIRELGHAGTDIVLTTQYLDEADHLAASIVIIDGGAVIAQGTPGRAQVARRRRHDRVAHPDLPSLDRAAQVLSSSGRGEPTIDRATRRCSLAAPAGARLLPAVVRALDEAGVAVEDISLRRPTLDEVFLALTGHTTDAHPPLQGARRMTSRPCHPRPQAPADPNGSPGDPGRQRRRVVSGRLRPGGGPYGAGSSSARRS